MPYQIAGSEMSDSLSFLKDKAAWVRAETLKIHRGAPETRIASSLSAVEIFTVLYYGGFLRFKPKTAGWQRRDRFIVSKAHGAISLYPIFSELGFFSREHLTKVCKEGSILGSIPDPIIPGFETVNGSLGHGLGVACGISLALKRKGRKESVYVLLGDGELYEGSVWEAIMFAAEHKLDNLLVIIDNNKICMLDYCRNIVNLEPLDTKFKAFGWRVDRTDGHDTEKLCHFLRIMKEDKVSMPRLLIADTIKGKGAPRLEEDALCHIKNLKAEEIDALLGDK